jgi:hypothetical protein
VVTRDTVWPDGTPCWVDLGTSDIPKAIAFYRGQFGWDVEQGGPEMGGYSMARLGGRNVAGIGPIMGPPGTPSAGPPTSPRPTSTRRRAGSRARAGRC